MLFSLGWLIMSRMNQFPMRSLPHWMLLSLPASRPGDERGVKQELLVRCHPAPLGVLSQLTSPPSQLCKRRIMSSCSWDAPPSPQERRSVDARPTSASAQGEQEILFRGVQQKPSIGGDTGESDLCCFSPTPKTPTSGLLLFPDGPRTLTTLIVSWANTCILMERESNLLL